MTLLSAPDAGIHAGAAWFGALIGAVRREVRGAELFPVLDCGDDAGAAQSALRAGIDAIVFTGRAHVAARLAGIAVQAGARLLTERPPDTLDLLPLFFAAPQAVQQRCTDFLRHRSSSRA